MAEFQIPWKFVGSEEDREAIAKSIVNAKHKSRIMVTSEGARIIPVSTPEQENDPLFQAISQTIKGWDIIGGDGNPAVLIFEAVKKSLAEQS